jgi:hypothetical protein
MDIFDVLAVDRLRAVADVLAADTSRSAQSVIEILTNEKRLDQFWARSLVRTFFAWIEAYVFELKLIIRSAAERGLIDLSEGELSLLNEVVYDVNDHGEGLRQTTLSPFRPQPEVHASSHHPPFSNRSSSPDCGNTLAVFSRGGRDPQPTYTSEGPSYTRAVVGRSHWLHARDRVLYRHSEKSS